MRVRVLRWMTVLVIGWLLWVAKAEGGYARAQGAGQPRALVYTRNGPGYVHANILASVEALKRIGAQVGFAMDATDDPAVFSTENLKRYAVIVFDNSDNEIFTTEEQRQALKSFVEHGGGVVGIHSALGAERNWPWFAEMMGGRFGWHPVEQDFKVQVVEPRSVETQGLPSRFTVHDECYFGVMLNPDIHPVLVTDRTALSGLDKAAEPVAGFPNPLPLAWWHTFDGGREFYLALGHEPSMYAEPWFEGVIQRALVWAGDVHSVHRG